MNDICPEKNLRQALDFECGDDPSGWCSTCHKRTTPHYVDAAALEASVKIMAVVNGSWLPGGAPQVQAKIQCIVIDALKRFAPAHQGVQAISAQSTQTDELSDMEIIDAAESQAALYDEDSRQDIKTDVMNSFYAGVAFAVSRLSSRKGKDAEDARRYRWLREGNPGCYDTIMIYAGNALDAAIDSAIEQGKDGGV